MARVVSLAELPDRGGPEYAQGLRAAVEAAVAYALEGMARGEHEGAPVPEPLLAQARRAARSGVGLDTVLRRYVAGHALLGDFLVQEAEGRVAPVELKRLFRRLAATLDCLLSAVTTAYRLEGQRSRRTLEHRRVDLVERLLGGEPLDDAELGYRLESHHLGLVVCGPGAEAAASTLAEDLSALLLTVPHEEGLTWAWLGTREALDPDKVRVAASASSATVSLGEPAAGRSGWRLTHRQARAALPLARKSAENCIRYADVAMLATVVQDDLLVKSLRRLYLDPLQADRGGGAILRETLRAYFAAGQNLSSAAGLLGIDRRTVSNRLRAIEALVGVSVDERATDLQMALDLDELRVRQ